MKNTLIYLPCNVILFYKRKTLQERMNNMPIVKTSAKCQIVIPSKLRKELGIEAGGNVLIEKLDDHHAIISALPDDPIKSLRGAIKGGKSMAQELLKERRKDNLHEENKTA